MGAGKSKSDDATMSVIWESPGRAFNSENPIVGMVKIDAKVTIPAYCIQATLQQKEHALKIDQGDKG